MNYKEINSSEVASSLFWKLLERSSAQIVQFIVAIIIARVLNPEEYGIVAMITIFISFATVFVQGGISTALIQKKDADDLDFSTLFFLTFCVALITYGILYFLAPFISVFYSMDQLTPVLRVMSLGLFPGALISIQNAIVARNMRFQKSFISNMFAVVISGAVGITMANLNYGEWALVSQQLVYKFSLALILFLVVKWRPMIQFSYERCKQLISFGSKILFANLIDTLYHNIQSLAIGRIYAPDVLAFFTKGKQFPLLLIDNLNGSIQSVMLPAYSSSQDNTYRLKQMLRRSLMISSFITFPAMIGMAVVAEPFIRLVLTDKWILAVPFMQIYCAIAMLFPINTSNLQVVNALGKSHLYLKLVTIKRVLGLILLSISIILFKNVFVLALVGLVVEIIATFFNMHTTSKLIDYKLVNQVKDLFPTFIISIIMGASVYSLNYLEISAVLVLAIQVSLGALFYLTMSYLLKLESFEFLLKFLRNKKINRSGNY